MDICAIVLPCKAPLKIVFHEHGAQVLALVCFCFRGSFHISYQAHCRQHHIASFAGSHFTRRRLVPLECLNQTQLGAAEDGGGVCAVCYACVRLTNE